MGPGRERNCKLCQNKMTEKDLKLTRDIVKEILEVLLIQINFNSKTSLICGTCTKKLLAAFNFKSVCLYTEDVIFPYTDSAEMSLLDLKRIYKEVNKNQEEALDDQEICRLCLKPVKVDFRMISEMNPDVLIKFLPEVNFALTSNPVICVKCHDALCVHSTFLRNCMDVEKKPNMDAIEVGNILLINPSIKMKELEIKSEESNDEINSDMKKEEHEQGDSSLHLCDLDYSKQTSAQSTVASYNCISESRLADHELSHKRDWKIQVNKSACNSKSQRSPKNQPKSITKGLKLQVYKCNKCNFKSSHKSSFRMHELIHKDPSEVRMFECDECDYKSILNGNLKKHQLRHKDPSEVQMFKCDECDYKCIKKGNLLTHQLIHKNSSEVPMFECDKCDYKSILKGNLKIHQLRHKDPLELRMFKCGQCDFKAIRKGNLHSHQLRHKDPSELRMFKCDQCDFKTKHKGNLKRHLLRHTNYKKGF